MSVEDIKNTLNGAAKSAEHNEKRDKIVALAASLTPADFETRIDEFINELRDIGSKWSKTFLKAEVRSKRRDNNEQEKARQREAQKVAKETTSDPANKYMIRDGGLIFRVGDEAERYDLQLSNFVAKILADITKDDGINIKHCFRLRLPSVNTLALSIYQHPNFQLSSGYRST